MTYKLTIIKYEPNSDYKPPRYDYQVTEAPKYIEKSLEIEVSEEQFNAIRKAVLEVF